MNRYLVFSFLFLGILRADPPVNRLAIDDDQSYVECTETGRVDGDDEGDVRRKQCMQQYTDDQHRHDGLDPYPKDDETLPGPMQRFRDARNEYN